MQVRRPLAVGIYELSIILLLNCIEYEISCQTAHIRVQVAARITGLPLVANIVCQALLASQSNLYENYGDMHSKYGHNVFMILNCAMVFLEPLANFVYFLFY